MRKNNKQSEERIRTYKMRRNEKTESDKVDFFVSCSHIDKKWAEWIVDCIETEGYTTFWGDRDLAVGDDFMLVIQKYLDRADKLIAILSPAYFASAYCQAEVTFMLQEGKKIIPVKVSEEQPTGEIAKLLYIDLYNVDKDDAKNRLLDVISDNKRKVEKSHFRKQADTRFPREFPTNNFKFSEVTVIGGDSKIQAISKEFSDKSVSNLIISGVGGVGKTTIAKKYIQMYGYLYDLIWWISAESSETILHEYEQLAIELKLVKNNENKENDIVNIVKQWMSSTKNWLFVFDNVNEYAIIQSFIPTEHKGNILIISRNSLLKDSSIDEITLHELTLEQAKEVLDFQGISGNNEEITDLIKLVGCLPSMLKTVAHFIKSNNLSIREFLLNNELNSSSYYSNLAAVYKEQGNYENALECYFRVLECSKEEKSKANTYFDIATIYQELGESNKALELYNKILELRQSDLNDNILIAKTLNNKATICLQKQEFEQAKELYKKSKEILYNEFNGLHPSIATALSNIASVCRVSNEYEEALGYNQKALLIRKGLLGDEHPDTALSYIDIAEDYLGMQKFSDALKSYEQALSIYENTLGNKHPDISYLYKNIGDIYQKLEDYETALKYYDKAMQIQQSEDFKKDNEFIYNTYAVQSSDNDSVNVTNLREEGELSPALKSIEQNAKDILCKIKEQDMDSFEIFYKYYPELVSAVLFIQNELVFNYDGKVEICHYSKISTLKHIIKQKNNEVQPKFRISNIAYLNDPSEGNVLLQILKKKMNESSYNILFASIDENEKLEQIPFNNVFIGSFTTAKNKLPMWTLYGDDSKGCCLVFDDYFFDDKNVLVEAKINEDKVSRNSQDLTLYKVKYIDFDKMNKEETNDVILDTIGKIANSINNLERVISRYESVRKWINDLLDMIRFLFKDFDYNYENEVRVIIHAEDAQIKLDDASTIPRLYVEIQKKLTYKEIILGSKIDKPVEIAPFLLHSGMVKKVTKSGIHYQ